MGTGTTDIRSRRADMTKKIHVRLIDDLDASEASETLRFEVDGRAYEIDLSSGNAQQFRAEIAPYIEHARRVATHARRRGRAGAGSGPPRGRAQATSWSSVLTSSGPAVDVTDGETTIPDYAGGPPALTDFGRDMVGRSPGPDVGDGEERAPS
jgi:hypothetical protein